jgi:hypothetical protein
LSAATIRDTSFAADVSSHKILRADAVVSHNAGVDGGMLELEEEEEDDELELVDDDAAGIIFLKRTRLFTISTI